MSKGEVSWWYACRTKGENAAEKWFLLFEFFSANATAYAVARIAASDGNCAWEGTFSADEIAVLSNTGGSQSKFFESIRNACETNLSDVCRVRRQGSEEATLIFSRREGRSVDLKLETELSCSAFADRTALYDSHLNANISAQRVVASELKKKRDSIEKKIQVAVKKSLELEENMVRGVRVLMQQKLEHFK